MNIKFKKRILQVHSPFSVRPNIGNLEKELKDFFDNNKIEGISIKKFRLEQDVVPGDYSIIPEKPYFEEELSGGSYRAEIEKIGKKYRIRNLGFIHWCYHK